ncbi:DUF302 domain-containing protein [Guyparkeria hydrothermalis]|uniref:DUF302 domain-containing protein n=1 Tax=Guyparkeria TaxID=2035712 RepID=UPI0010AB6DFC|nr:MULTISPECIES: DUF302 domain-containing protein [Guyparkeria]MCL7750630.1 DUF302 domain-containing protein [Guyparkeria hydrothermalis]TKA89052.1 DUF302 domain-containing protein [Guyparkeria sp. SB14A]
MKHGSQWLGRGLIGAAFLLPFAAQGANGLNVIESQHGVAETEERLVEAVEGKGLTVMAQVDHQANAQTVDLEMPPTRVVIFGNPQGGTQLMKCAPTVAIDLPMKMLIWQDGETVKVGYNRVDYLVERHGIGDCAAPVQETMKKTLDGLAHTAAGD